MVRFSYIVVLLLVVQIAFGQGKEERSLPRFDELKVSQGIKVILHRSTSHKAIVETDKIELDEVETEVDDGVLEISLDGNNYKSIDVVINLYYSDLNEIRTSSAASVFASENIKGDKLKIRASSAGTIDIQVDVMSLSVDVSSAADVKLTGNAHEVDMEVSSAGSVQAYELEAEYVDVAASSAGSAKVYVSQNLKAKANSGGNIKYKGDPSKSNNNSSSGGSVKKAWD